MADHDAAKDLLRTALTAPALSARRAALTTLCKEPALAPALAAALLARAPTFTDPHSAHLAGLALARAAEDAATVPALKKRLTALALAVTRVPQPSRAALALVRVVAPLAQVHLLLDPVLDAVLAAVAAIEADPAPLRGPQARARVAALRAVYSAATGAVARADLGKLFAAADAFAKDPYRAVAALGCLSAVGVADDDADRLLGAVTTMAMKGGAEIAMSLARVATGPLADVSTERALANAVPVIERALLRQPEAALAALEHLLRALVSVDLSTVAEKSLFPAVLTAVKNSDAETRATGIRLAAVLASRMKDPRVLQDAIASLCDILKTAKYAYQRVAAMEAVIVVTRFAVRPSGKDAQRSLEPDSASSLPPGFVDSALAVIVEWLSSKKETNEEARSAGLRATISLLQQSLVRNSNEPPLAVSDSGSNAALLLSEIVSGKRSESDRRAALIALTNDVKASAILSTVLGGSLLPSLCALSVGGAKIKLEDSLRATALLATWAQADEAIAAAVRTSAVWSTVGKPGESCVLIAPSSLTTVNDALCVLTCCEWLVESNHPDLVLGFETVFKLSVDVRPKFSQAAQAQIRRLRANADDSRTGAMFDALWRSQFCGAAGASSVAQSYDIDDGGRAAATLGTALLLTVLPNVPTVCIPRVLMAANHPRLLKNDPASSTVLRSRWWACIENALPEVETDVFAADADDWLVAHLEALVGDDGLCSKEPPLVEAAVNAIGALVAETNAYSARVLRLLLPMLQPLAHAAPSLSPELLEAMDIVRSANKAAAIARQAGAHAGLDSGRKGLAGKKASKKSSAAIGSSGNARVDQQRQAELDRARASATSAAAAAEKAEAAKYLAMEAERAFELTSAALAAIRTLAAAAPRTAHRSTAALLSLVLPSAKHANAETNCRLALLALVRTAGAPLKHLAMDIATTLFVLESGEMDIRDTVAKIIHAVRAHVPPALSAEDFALVAPIIRASLLRDPDSEDRGISSGRHGGSTRRREAIAVVKAGAQVLLEHCKPEAIDAAVAAAASHAGSWAVCVMEREDGAFAAAADALALLTGTALSPGTPQLAQVLGGVISGKSSVRDGALAALARLPPLTIASMECPRDSILGRTLWLARFDPDEANAALADELWTNYNHPLFVREDAPSMLALLGHAESDVRLMAARGIAEALRGKEHAGTRNVCIPQMFTLYLKKVPSRAAPETSSAGAAKMNMPPPPVSRSRDKVDPNAPPADEGWPAREGVALAIEEMALRTSMTAKDIPVAFAFLAGRGLGDRHDVVRAKMSAAATAVVGAAGTLGPSILLPMIEKQLSAVPPSSATKEDVAHADRTRENLVMCLGAVAGFLPSDDPRVAKTADQVIRSAINTPSEVVQNAAARCLVPLAASSMSGARETEVRNELIRTVWDESASYGERRGAAYALAGISRGRGLKCMKRMNIMEEVWMAVSEKSPRRRQGAFLLIETHAILLERLFEPYTVSALPFLLTCMGDSVVEVRDACWAAAQASMAEMSSQGVKMILPALLSGLQDRQWRTKAGAAEVLGAMAFCAPRQLALCLPQVVPKLADALADAHPRVVGASESAINRIAAVVRSPEVRNLSPFLLAALRDPSTRTRGAIDAMLGTEFVHAIDTASLALLIPPLHRGLRDRSSELKKRAAAIVGSMCNNVANVFDVTQYLDLLLPPLRITLLDAIPDVRRTSARALGALAVALGEEGLPDIVPWLLNALLGGSQKAPVSADGGRGVVGSMIVSSSAERSGAAMGLAEVSASLTEQRFEEVLKLTLNAGHGNAQAREGGLMLLAAMPRALGERFEEKLGVALSAILRGLSDDADAVREAAFEAGRNLVSAYAKTSLEHLLPELLAAMRDKLWRIRQAAARLLGDMLLVIAGARVDRPEVYGSTDAAGNDAELKESDSDEDGEGGSGEDGEGEKSEDDDEEYESPEQMAAAMTTEATMKAIEEVLGFERRNEVLAALYIIRCDVSIRVRQTGMQVWKTVVSNTPRVLREIMPCAVRQVVEALGDEDDERRAAAGKTLGDLSQKLGDRVVPEVLPALRAGLTDKDSSARVRKGACEGLGELVFASPRQQLVDNAQELIGAVYEGLCDELADVRATAAGVFSTLLRPLGDTAVDAVVPLLIEKISTGTSPDVGRDRADAERALDGLKQILHACGNRLMSIVVPRLLAEEPLSAAAARALSAAATVAGSAFEPHIADVARAILLKVESMSEEESMSDVEILLRSISYGGDKSIRSLFEEIFAGFNEGFPARRTAASRVCEAFCVGAEPDVVSSSAGPLFEVLIRQLADIDAVAVQAAWQALSALSSSVPHRALSLHIPTIRQSMRSAGTGVLVGDSAAAVPGLQIPKAPAPFVPIFTDGLLHGAPELREAAALGIAELVEMTNSKSLAPFVIKLTGPLIRVMSDRFPWQVKAAILRAMLVLLEKAPVMLRTFAPQLQSTFVKSLSDSNRVVRFRACAALGALVPIQSRLEPLLNDLVSLGVNGGTEGSRSAAFHACSQVFRYAKSLPASCFTTLPEAIGQGLSDEEPDVAKAAGRTLGLLAARCEEVSQYTALLDLVVQYLEADGVEYTERVYALLALGAIYASNSPVEAALDYSDLERSALAVKKQITSAAPPSQQAACSAAADFVKLLVSGPSLRTDNVAEQRTFIADIAGRAECDENVEVRIAALEAIKSLICKNDAVLEICMPGLVICAAETNTGIRNAADRALRRAFIAPKVLTVIQDNVTAARDTLHEDDQKFIERRIPKLRALPESDDEGSE